MISTLSGLSVEQTCKQKQVIERTTPAQKTAAPSFGNKEVTWEATPEKLAGVAVLTVRPTSPTPPTYRESLEHQLCLLLTGDVAKSVECLPSRHGKPWAPPPTLQKTEHGIEHL